MYTFNVFAAKEQSNTEEDLLFRSGEFGDENPEALQRTVWWLLALHFGFHARDESRKLKLGDIVLQMDSERGNEVPAMAMVIHEHLIQRFRQQTANVVQFIITRNSKVAVQKKWTTLTARFTWPSIIEKDQATALGT